MSAAITAAVVAAGIGAYSANQSSKRAAKSISDQNAANTALHTMTPEEKAQFFTGGVGKVNDATASSQGMLDRNLAARGLGGNAVVAPNANLQRARIKSIADIWNQLTQTSTNMKLSTPSMSAVPGVVPGGEAFMSTMASGIGGAASPIAGKAFADWLKWGSRPAPTTSLLV